MAKMKKCKACGAEIASSAKTCPHCGAKNGGSKVLGIIFIILAVLLLALALGGIEDSGDPPSGSNQADSSQESHVEITYEKYSVSEMMDDLEDNSMAANEKYKKQYVEITGRLAVIDSEGKYIGVFAYDNPYAITGVNCSIQNDEQKAVIMEKSVGDQITVRGKITNVGEIFGYYLDIDEVL